MNVATDWYPWTSSHLLRGCPKTARIKEVVELGWLRHMIDKKQDPTTNPAELDPRFWQSMWCDLSQNPRRRASSQGTRRCSTTSSFWYSYTEDRVLVDIEYFTSLGFDDTVDITGCSMQEIQSLTGDAFALPSVGSILPAAAVSVDMGIFENAIVSE